MICLLFLRQCAHNTQLCFGMSLRGTAFTHVNWNSMRATHDQRYCNNSLTSTKIDGLSHTINDVPSVAIISPMSKHLMPSDETENPIRSLFCFSRSHFYVFSLFSLFSLVVFPFLPNKRHWRQLPLFCSWGSFLHGTRRVRPRRDAFHVHLLHGS